MSDEYGRGVHLSDELLLGEVGEGPGVEATAALSLFETLKDRKPVSERVGLLQFEPIVLKDRSRLLVDGLELGCDSSPC